MGMLQLAACLLNWTCHVISDHTACSAWCWLIRKGSLSSGTTSECLPFLITNTRLVDFDKLQSGQATMIANLPQTASAVLQVVLAIWAQPALHLSDRFCWYPCLQQYCWCVITLCFCICSVEFSNSLFASLLLLSWLLLLLAEGPASLGQEHCDDSILTTNAM